MQAVTSQIASLPYELLERIIDLACHDFVQQFLPPQSPGGADCDPQSSTGRPAEIHEPKLDYPTTLKLCSLSRSTYRQVTSILYRDVTLSRPGKLHAFLKTIAARPALGRLVRVLWIGPVERYPDDWWPVHAQRASDEEGPSVVLTSSLEDTSLLPHGVPLGRRWVIWAEGQRPTGKSLAARVQQALSTGRPLFVGTSRGSHSFRRGQVAAFFHLQAALDLYLVWLRKRQDQAIAKGGSVAMVEARLDFDCPSFRIAQGEEGAADADDDVFVCTAAMAREWLQRPGSQTDRFDHPLLYDESGLLHLAVPVADHPDNHEAAFNNFVHQDEQDVVYHDEGDDLEHDAALLSGLEAVERWRSHPEGPSSLHLSAAELDVRCPIVTLGSILIEAKGLLAMLPNIEHLALTDFLERLMTGCKNAPLLECLNSVSIGPTSPVWTATSDLTGPQWRPVDHLNINGRTPRFDEACSIAGHDGALPYLRYLQWTMWDINDPRQTAARLKAWLTVPDSADVHRRIQPLHITAYLPLPTIEWLRSSVQEAAASAEEARSTYTKHLHAALLGGGSNRLAIYDVYPCRLDLPLETRLQLTDKSLIDAALVAVRRHLNKLQVTFYPFDIRA
ncbi:unnamed protein product [Jaminaea pallidilutea]